MKLKLKPVKDQVIVITGASSGIGLATARMAAEKGAKLVLAARNEAALTEIKDELTAAGKEVECVVADVAIDEDVRRIERAAMQRFGRIDTWVNDAGVSVYGKLLDLSMEDAYRLFDTNFFGLVLGSRVAVGALRVNGGALINIGSSLSDRAIPLQGMYSASKHAVKGFTDALRMELQEEGAPISVTLIKPGAIDTPYVEHAKNQLDVEPKNAPPYYSPRVVAEAILHAAAHPTRDLFVGGSAKAISVAGQLAPKLSDAFMVKTMFKSQRTKQRRLAKEPGALYGPGDDGREYGSQIARVREGSLYTKMTMHPVLTVLIAGGAVLAGALLTRRA